MKKHLDCIIISVQQLAIIASFLKGDMVKLKKYFYVIRPLLACKWILDRNCPPPMLFSELVEAVLEPEMRPIIANLLERKMNMPEMGEDKRIERRNRTCDGSHLTRLVKNFP